MKKETRSLASIISLTFFVGSLLTFAIPEAFAFDKDLSITTQNIQFSSTNFMEGRKIAIEGDLLEKSRTSLEQIGHLVDAEMSMWTAGFGGGQGIMIDYDEDCLTAGSDWRKDGCAAGY